MSDPDEPIIEDVPVEFPGLAAIRFVEKTIALAERCLREFAELSFLPGEGARYKIRPGNYDSLRCPWCYHTTKFGYSWTGRKGYIRACHCECCGFLVIATVCS